MSEIPTYWRSDMLGAALTTMRVGGPVRYFAVPRTLEELIETIALANKEKLPYKVIGGGSNLLIADDGYDGVMIRPRLAQIAEVSSEQLKKNGINPDNFNITDKAQARYVREEGKDFLYLQEAGETAKKGEVAYVEAGAGVPWGQLVQWTLSHSLKGLEYFARIPCMVGGAVYNNIHGERHLVSESVAAVQVYDPSADKVSWLSAPEMEFGYDMSVLHREPLIVLSVVFMLEKVSGQEAEVALNMYKEWTLSKGKVQPTAPSAGSVFQNLPLEEAKDGRVSAAWYVDNSGCKGLMVGGMQVYPGHANFIINLGNGTQADFLRLVHNIQQQVKIKFGVKLDMEIECIDRKGRRMA